MKDRIFEGPDKEAALQRASETLGVPTDELRYVVLDERAGRAQIAVMGVRASSESASVPDTTPEDEDEEEDPAEGVREIVAGMCRAADLDLSVEIVESKDRLLARLEGADADFFTADQGRVLSAFEYLLQRIYGDAVRTILVDANGYREQREDGLRRQAATLAQAVGDDGEARQTEPLNSYERRIVHMVISDLEGVSSRSEGEGPRRRVLIEPSAS